MKAAKNYSILRYPGGKNKLTNYIKELLKVNNLSNITYIEPYAGGAAVALNLLISGTVNKIIINDIDRSIYALWYSVLNHTNELCELIITTNITIEEWYIQKEIQNNKDNCDLLRLGFSTLFLNRTNRSGIIKGGVIGGLSQKGNYKLDCRFNKQAIIEKIKTIASHKNKIKLYNLDTIELINKVIIGSKEKSFIFFDPPYYKKGSSLYVNHYSHNDHVELCKKISKLRKDYLLITYDNVEAISKLYSKFYNTTYSLKYSAQNKYEGSEIMIFGKKLFVSDELKKINNYL